MFYLAGYLGVLISFGIVDAIWLRLMGPLLYRPTLGSILLADVRLGPAAAFYLIYPIGLLVFAVVPAMKGNSLLLAAGSGLLFGGVAYATYDLTNYATLRNWTLPITIVDIAYGALASGLAATTGLAVVRTVSKV